MDDELPSLLHRSDAVLDGETDSQLRSRRQSGELVRVARGSYLRRDEHSALVAADLHRVRVAAVAHRHGDGAVISHVSAAAMHGYDLWGAPLEVVHVTQSGPGNGKRGQGVHRHREQLAAREVVSVGGLRVTSPARTIADLARSVEWRSAVVTGDCALRQGLSLHALTAAVAAAKGRHGAPNARRAVELMDGRSGSVGESLSRLKIRELKLPTPDLQKEVCDANGNWIGRTDFYFPGLAVVGEFDGKVKYGKHLKPGQHPGDAVFLEKIREDRIRATGLVVVRWVWDDLRRPLELRRRICDAFERGRNEIRLNPALANL